MNNPGSNNFGNLQGGASQPTQIFCPNCRNANVANATFCSWCGSRLAPHPQSQYGQALQVQPQQPYPTYPAPPPPQQYHPAQTTIVYPQTAQPPPHYQQAQPHYSQGATSNMTVVMQAPPQQAYHRPYAAMASQKSVGLAVFLAFLFGPLGMFYSTIGGAITMLLLSCGMMSAFFVLGLGTTDEYGYSNSGAWLLLYIVGYIVFQIICMVWAGMAASSHNRRAIYG